GGENLIITTDKIKAQVEEMRKNSELPPNLKVVFTGDQSVQTRTSFNELINTMVIGFILVLLVLMFSLGVTNGFFGLLFGLGIIVDDSIVVIENTHRIFQNGRMPIKTAAKMAAGEVFVPV